MLRSAQLLPATFAATLLPAQGRDTEEVADALARARPALMVHLRQTHGGLLALSCLAALHDGVPLGDEHFGSAIDRLSRARLESTYELALRLMVMAEHPDFPRRAELAPRDTELLMQRQTTGGFSYGASDGWWDMSNTQYAALGMRAAVSLGQEIPLQRWRLLLHAVSESQTRSGGFSYRGSSAAYSSMTVAGIAVLQICRQNLDLDPAEERQLDLRLERAWQWMAGHSPDIGNPRAKNSMYFHYGLERAAILSDIDMIGDVDWYEEGAAMLIKYQLGSGGWRNELDFRPKWNSASTAAHPVDTAFAILFLRRRFQKEMHTVPLTGPRRARSLLLAPDADEPAIREAVAVDRERGLSVVPDLLRCLRSTELARRKAATLAIYGITGQHFGLHPYRAPDRDAEAIKRAELWWLRHNK